MFFNQKAVGIFTFVLFGLILTGCVTTSQHKRDFNNNVTSFEFDGHANMARILEKKVNEGINVRLAISTEFNADYNSNMENEERKILSKDSIRDYETKLSLQFERYFIGKSSFSLVDTKALTPIAKANFLLYTNIYYRQEFATYRGKLIDINNEETIGFFDCQHSGTPESLQCY